MLMAEEARRTFLHNATHGLKLPVQESEVAPNAWMHDPASLLFIGVVLGVVFAPSIIRAVDVVISWMGADV